MKLKTLRIGAISAFLSIPILIIASLLHGGYNSADIQTVLPQYAANSNWKAVHLGQFIGFLMMIGSVVVLLDYIQVKSGSPFALLGLLTAFVAASKHKDIKKRATVNQQTVTHHRSYETRLPVFLRRPTYLRGQSCYRWSGN